MKRRIAVIGGIIEILESAHDLGLETVLVHQPGRAAPGSQAYCSEILDADFKHDYRTVESLLVERHRRRPFERVFSLTENGLIPAARINELLGLGGNSVESVRLLKDKSAMRGRLDEVGLGPVRHRVVRSRAELAEFRRGLGRPAFVKPVDGAGSVGVFKADTDAEIRAGWAELAAQGRTEALAEEFLEGPEFSVEGFLWQGTHHVIAITETLLSPTFFELGHTMPADLDEPTVRAVHRAVADFLAAIGLTEGPTHTEVRVTPDGPRILESHNRIGGERIHELMQMAFGVDITRMTVAVPLGLEPMPQLPTPRQHGAAMKHLLPIPGRVVEISGVDRLPTADPTLRIRIGVGVGTEVGAVTDGVSRDAVASYVLASGPTAAAAEQRCAEVLSTVRITTCV